MFLDQCTYICISIYLSIYLSTYLSIYLSIYSKIIKECAGTELLKNKKLEYTLNLITNVDQTEL